MAAIATVACICLLIAGVSGQGTLTFSVGSEALGLAFDTDGMLWVVNSGDDSVTRLSATGTLIGTYPTRGLRPACVATSGGDVWVTNSGSNNAVLLGLSGVLLGTYPVGSSPMGIVVAKNGYTWVANSASSTVTLLSFGAAGGTYNTGANPVNIASDQSNNVWTANQLGKSVTNIASDGTLIGTYDVPTTPWGIAIDSQGNVWTGELCKLSTSGVLLASFSVAAQGITIDSNNDVWITSINSNIVTELSNTGTLYATYTVGQQPKYIAIDSLGNAWVSNEGDGTVTEILFSNSGTIQGPGLIAIVAVIPLFLVASFIGGVAYLIKRKKVGSPQPRRFVHENVTLISHGELVQSTVKASIPVARPTVNTSIPVARATVNTSIPVARSTVNTSIPVARPTVNTSIPVAKPSVDASIPVAKLEHITDTIPIATIVLNVNTASQDLNTALVAIWKKRVEQLERFFIMNNIDVGKERQWENALGFFEDYPFEEIIKTLQDRYPDRHVTQEWLDDLKAEKNLGRIPASIVSVLKNR